MILVKLVNLNLKIEKYCSECQKYLTMLASDLDNWFPGHPERPSICV